MSPPPSIDLEPAAAQRGPTEPTAGGRTGPDRPVDEHRRRPITTIVGAAVLLALAVAVVVVMQTGSPPATVEAAGTADAAIGPDEGPVPTVGAPRGTTASTATTLPAESTTVVEPDATTTSIPAVTTATARPTTGAPSAPSDGGAVPTTAAPSGPVTGPDVVPTTPAPTTAPVTAPPTTRYVPQFSEVEIDYAADGVTLVATNPRPSIPTGGRAYWTNHTPLTGLELIVNGSSYGALDQHRSTKIDFPQAGTYSWSIAGHPELTGTIVVG